MNEWKPEIVETLKICFKNFKNKQAKNISCLKSKLNQVSLTAMPDSQLRQVSENAVPYPIIY